MQITIELPSDVEEMLAQEAERTNLPVRSVILNALRRFSTLTEPNNSKWPPSVATFEGDPDFPPFESYRDELSPLREQSLF